jgi:hypothetical protein
MKSIVTPEEARTEGSSRQGTNHPWEMIFLGPDRRVVDEKRAEGFACARKAAPKLIGGKVASIVITGPNIPEKFRSDFKSRPIPGKGTLTCFVVGALT